MTNILIVEDSSIQAEMLRRVLVAANYEVSIGRNGAEGLSMAQSRRPDLIISDVTMPIMDGFGFLDEFDRLPGSFTTGIKVAMLTSSLEKEEIRRSYEYKNVVDFINKPLSTEKIVILADKIIK